MKSLMKRRKVIVVFGVVLLIVVITVSVLANERWLFSISEGNYVHIVIDNRTDQQLGSFVITDHQDSAIVQIDRIDPLSKIEVDYITSETWGENAIIMEDSIGNQYTIVGYFEHTVRGRVDIQIECVTSDCLFGKRRDFTSYLFPSFEWYSFGTVTCEQPELCIDAW